MVVEFLQINLHHSKAASAALLIRLATLKIRNDSFTALQTFD